jgi:beta-phosphoglucomutase-like phosphatase (HAD superfamily)
MNPSEPQRVGVVFDLDGTLVDSEPYWIRGFTEGLSDVLAERGFGRHPISDADMARFLGGRAPDTIRTIISSIPALAALTEEEVAAVVDDVIDWVVRDFTAHPQGIDESVEAAVELHAEGVPLAIASSSSSRFIDAAVEVLGLAEIFPVRVSALDFPIGKPDPSVYLATLGMMDLEPHQAVAVEDSPVGVVSALRAGLRCLWFTGPATEAAATDSSWMARLREVDAESPISVEDVSVTEHVTAAGILSLLGALRDGDN